MAELSKCVIIDKEKYLFGAAFNIIKPLDISEVISLSGGWELVLNSNSHYVILRGKDYKGDLNDFSLYCYEVIQKGLDLLSINGKADISIESGNEEYYLWWKTEKQYFRIVRLIDFNLKSSVNISAIDQNGDSVNLIPKKVTKHHESLRYYRLSQVTEDLFDAFRNMYLAFESLLSLNTNRRKGEKEGDWLKRALNNLAYFKGNSELFGNKNMNIVDKFYKEIYIEVRCKLFHAKSNQKKLIPQNLQDRKKVSEAFQILTQVVLMLADNLLGINRETAIVTNSGFSSIFSDNFKSINILFSERKDQLSLYESKTDELHKCSFSLKAFYSKSLSTPGISYYTGSVNPLKIKNVSSMNRFALTLENELMSIHKIDELTFEGIDEIEVNLGYRLQNSNLPKNTFYH